MSLPNTILVLCCLCLVASLLTGCGSTATPLGIASVPTATPSRTARPSPSPSPTWPPLPTVPAAKTSAAGRRTATWTPSPSATPSHTARAGGTTEVPPSATPSATATLSPTPSATPTASRTPGPPPPSITPTLTITPTPSPTLTPTPLFSPTPLPTVAAAAAEEVVNILLIGLDSSANLRGQNTDVIIVASVNKDTRQVSMLSIPRDLWVYIPTVGWSRINVAHRKGFSNGYPGGGSALLMDTIEMHFGIPLHHWVRIDFEGFKRVVDELGGVQMTVVCPVNLRYKPPDSEEEEERYLEPGVYHMDGDLALRYVRTRRDTTDFDRARRQHQFLKAVWNQVKSPDLVLKLPGLWSAVRDSFETDLALGDVISLAPVALELKPQRIRSRYISYGQTIDWRTAEGWRVLLPDYERIQQVVASLYGPPLASEEQAANEAARIAVQNGTYRHQLAQIAADQLRWHGLKVVDTGLADNPDYQETQIVVFVEKPAALEVLIEELGARPRNVSYQLDPNQDADILVILGNDYDPCR